MANQLTITRGDTEPLVITLTDSTGAAIDITGYTFFFTVKTKPDTDDTDSQALITRDVTTHSDPTGGVTTITLTSTDTAVAAGLYLYDIQYKDTSGNICTIVEGDFRIIDDITRRTS